MRQGFGGPMARAFARRCLSPVLVLAAPLLIAVPAVPAAANPDLDAASSTLKATIEEWRREDAAYRAARSAGKISRRESDEYAEFVATLRLRVLEQCEVVRGLGGEAAVQPFDCLRSGNRPRAAAVVVPPAAVLTDEEKRAAMQARLDALEVDIDEALLKRQEELRQKGAGNTAGGVGGGTGGGSASGASGSSGSGGSGSSASGGAAGTSGSTGAGQARTGSWSNPDAATGPGGVGAAGATGGKGPATGTVGDEATTPSATRQAARDGGSDDDVVARQLREAAERETDPVLKEKLWAEYRKYRESKR